MLSKPVFHESNRPLSQWIRALAAIFLIALSFFHLLVNAQGVRPETVASGLQNPWAVAFLPDGKFLVTERPGRLRVVDQNGKLGQPVEGLPDIVAGGQGGLLDVVLDADFARNRVLYFCFSEPANVADGGGKGNSTALARATLSTDLTRLSDVKVIFSQ